ncbi:translin-associated factor X-interacting protein 1-like [Hyalella azteca]|uniref:Translin-associated factor X-interacting protein 1-like n=1 Tax=Hyalella azteca TaxID=294128 RepID=A0A8B7PIN4_HYAAZ|nr:translin-associated factor X-interacting protein 1-like [Hyalella azteca]
MYIVDGLSEDSCWELQKALQQCTQKPGSLSDSLVLAEALIISLRSFNPTKIRIESHRSNVPKPNIGQEITASKLFQLPRVLQMMLECLQQSKCQARQYDAAIESKRELQRQLDDVMLLARLNHREIIKAEEALQAEVQTTLQLRRDSEALTARLLQAKVEAAGCRKRLLRYEGPDRLADPELLAIAYQKCKEQLSRKEQQVLQLTVAHRDAVPRAQYQRSQRKLADVAAAHAALTHAHAALLREHRALSAQQQKALVERDRLATENSSLRRSATPRPAWDRVSEHLEGGVATWREVSQDCHTSEDFLTALLTHLTAVSVTHAHEFLTAKGVSEEVPEYLRYEGVVRNRRLTLRDVQRVITHVWQEKRSAPGTRAMPMDKYLAMYFEHRYHLPEMRAEWCYSLADACQRLAHDDQVGLFWGIATGQVEEAVYHHQADTAEALLATFRNNDILNKGLVSHTTVLVVLRTVFPLKDEESLDDLLSSAKAIATSRKDATKIKYATLFKQSADGSVSPFLQEVYQQARDEQEQYVQDVLQELGQHGIHDVKLQDLQRAFTVVDPAIEQQQLQQYLQWVYRGDSAVRLPLQLLAARLQTGHIVRVGPRPT